MARKLATSVHVHDGSETVVYAAGDSPTAAHAKLITNPVAWDGEDDEPVVVPKESAAKKAGA